VTPTVALLAFALAGAIITITPGLDTVLMLRTVVLEGPRRAAAAGLGICCGLVLWGLIVAFGPGALLTVSTLAYTVLQWTGAAYLLWLGLGLLLNPRQDALQTDASQTLRGGGGHCFVRGLLTNLLKSEGWSVLRDVPPSIRARRSRGKALRDRAGRHSHPGGSAVVRTPDCGGAVYVMLAEKPSRGALARQTHWRGSRRLRIAPCSRTAVTAPKP
jgi:hypothetical protein